MKIRTKITLLFIFITAMLLTAYAITIYYAAKENREKEFYNLLKKEAHTKARLFFEAKVEPSTLQEIYISNREVIHEVEVAIYDPSFTLRYHDAVEIDHVKETPEMIDNTINKGYITFYEDDWQVVGVSYQHDGKKYAIIAAAYDEYGLNKLDNLKQNITWASLAALIVIGFTGYFFSVRTLKPLRDITNKAQKISAFNLDLRLKENKNNDELTELASTFNKMLERLENSFEEQKKFVSNISHELRTPLSAIITELELSLNNTSNTPESYQKTLQNTLNDAKRLVKLSNSLLDLAKASYDPSEISFKKVRIDEILLDARQQVLQYDTAYKVNINFDEGLDDESKIVVTGNEYLLRVAFINLIENSCKFSSDNTSIISISGTSGFLRLDFKNKGTISADDKTAIFKPFYRGMNKYLSEGNGIGLSLTQKIIELHYASIMLDVDEGYTVFRVELAY